MENRPRLVGGKFGSRQPRRAWMSLLRQRRNPLSTALRILFYCNGRQGRNVQSDARPHGAGKICGDDELSFDSAWA